MELSVRSAVHGGFIVWEPGESHVFNPPLFAGDADAVIAFIAERIHAVAAEPVPVHGAGE